MSAPMPDIERLRAMMLEHVYGLLDGEELAELTAFLATPDGESLKKEGERWQERLAGAAQAAYPQVKFETPIEKTSAADVFSVVSPSSEGESPRPSMLSISKRWAIAASVVVLAGLAFPFTLQFISVTKQQSAVARAKSRISEVADEVNLAKENVRLSVEEAQKASHAAQEALDKKNREYEESIANQRKILESKEFLVRLTGPSHAQPGAPNEWRVETLNKNGAYTLPKKIEIVMRDQNNRELLRQTQDKPQAPPTLKLPASFWEGVRSDSELFLEVVAYNDEDRKSVLAEKVPLAGPVFVTQIVTDKPLYKPGEVVRYRSLTLDRATFTPPDHDMHLKFRLRDPSSAVVALETGNGRVMDGHKPLLGPDKKPVRGLGIGDYEIPEGAPGGEYELQVFERNEQNGIETLLDTRKFIVNNYVVEEFQKKLEFDGKSYGAGEQVQAKVEASRTAGGPLKSGTANVVASIEGVTFYSESNLRFNTKGVLNLRFKLPANVGNGNATLSVTILDGGQPETIVRPIPVIGKQLNVEFFPESGDLVEGVPSRVYVQVRTPQGKPADLKGKITDGKDVVAEFATLTDADLPGVNRGQGTFVFTPVTGKKYFLKVESPSSIVPPLPEGYPIPSAKPDGVVLTSLDATTERNQPIRLRVQGGQGKKILHIGAYARGRLIEHKRVELDAGKASELQLHGDEKLGGVTRVTVFEEPANAGAGRVNLIPRAERLIYRKPAEQLKLSVNPNKTRYSPADKVKLDLGALNEKDVASPAVLMVAVVNQSVITMADMKTDKQLPTHFLIGGEVKNPAELEHADFLLTEHPKASIALDLLLGTQGWRRFAEQNVVPANAQDQVDVNRMLVSTGQRSTTPIEINKKAELNIRSEFLPVIEELSAKLAEQEERSAKFYNEELPALNRKVELATSSLTIARSEAATASALLSQIETRGRVFRAGVLSMIVALLVILGLAIFAWSIISGRTLTRRSRNWAMGGFGIATVLLAFVLSVREANDPDVFFALSNAVKPEARFEKIGAQVAPDVKPGAVFDKLDGPPMLKKDFAPVPMMEMMGGGGGGPGGVMDAAARGGPPMPPGVAPMAKPGMPQGQRFARNFAMEGLQAKGGGRGDLAQLKNNQNRKNFAGAAAMRNRGVNAAMGLADQAMPMPRMAEPGGGRGFGAARGPIMPGAMPPPLPPVEQTFPFVFREYAHQRPTDLNPGIRSDFTETVYWHPVLVLPDNAKTEINFELSDSIATYQVLVAGHTLDGRIGSVLKTIEARKPFTVDPKLPIEINSGDTIDVPIRVVNDSDNKRSVSFTLEPNGFKVEGVSWTNSEGLPKDSIQLEANEKGRKVFRLRPNATGEASLVVKGNSEPAAEPDTVGRVIKVVPEGFPGIGANSDMLEKRANGVVLLPKDLLKGTLKAKVEVFPTTMADLVKGLDGLLREPNGCFEQTSTSNYPNTLILDLLSSSPQANPELSKRAKDLLDRGYAKLTSFECPDTPSKQRQGFEWFGSPDMAHEALTAYGLLQFKDMARVYKVDTTMIKRTQEFLMGRRDGKGGFLRNSRALDSFGNAPKHTTDAYITWALVESDPENKEGLDLSKEIESLKSQALAEGSKERKDSYFMALVANILSLRNDRPTALKLLTELQSRLTKDGGVDGAETSITFSHGRDLQIETTAMALLGWIRSKDLSFAATVKKSTTWITQQRGGYGGFGSTQSTIMALKALIAYAKANAHPAEAGEITFSIGGKRVAARKYSAEEVESITLDLDNPETIFVPGEKTEFLIETTSNQPYPFTFSYSYTTLTPVASDKCDVRLSTKLAKETANEGEVVPLSVVFENKKNDGQGMTVAVIGIPAGMKVPTDLKQLTDLREKKIVSYFEVRGRELVLYWRNMAPNQKIELSIDLVCDVPGEYRGPASRGYVYYSADHKHWIEPLKIKINPLAPVGEKTVSK